MRRDWARANQVLQTLSGVRRTELGYVVGSVARAGRIAPADRRPAGPDVPDHERQRALLARLAAPGARRGGRRSGAIPRSSSTTRGTACSSSPWPRWGRANAIAGACLAALRSRTAKDTCRHRLDDALAGPADVAGRAALGLSRVGVLLRLRDRLPAVGERDDAGDRDPGALARLPGARADALEARRRAGAGGVRAAAAERRGRAGQRRQALPPVLLRAVASRLQRRPAGGDRPARRGRAAALLARPPAVQGRRSRRAARGRRVRHGRVVAVLGAGRGVDAELPRADGELPRRALRAREGEGLLPRERALRALRARADEDRRGRADPVERRAHDDRAVPPVEGLEREGAGAGARAG